MGCEVIQTSEGTMILCGRGARGATRQCAYPGCGRAGTQLCDWRIPEPARTRAEERGVTYAPKVHTCDRPCCIRYSQHVGYETDYCWEHAAQPAPSRGA